MSSVLRLCVAGLIYADVSEEYHSLIFKSLGFKKTYYSRIKKSKKNSCYYWTSLLLKKKTLGSSETSENKPSDTSKKTRGLNWKPMETSKVAYFSFRTKRVSRITQTFQIHRSSTTRINRIPITRTKHADKHKHATNSALCPSRYFCAPSSSHITLRLYSVSGPVSVMDRNSVPCEVRTNFKYNTG